MNEGEQLKIGGRETSGKAVVAWLERLLRWRDMDGRQERGDRYLDFRCNLEAGLLKLFLGQMQSFSFLFSSFSSFLCFCMDK